VLRAELAQKAFAHTAGYDKAIAEYLASRGR
jgi:AICAR transformylase/IMP cyclohydrolase PurH